MNGRLFGTLELYVVYCSFRITFEFPATGGVIPLARFRTVKLLKYVSAGDYFIMACEIIFCAFIFYYYVEEFLEIKKEGMKYFFSVWNVLDIVVLIVSHLLLADIIIMI